MRREDYRYIGAPIPGPVAKSDLTAAGPGAASFARSLLFGLQPSDPATIAVAAAGLAAVAAAASLLPAHRAATLDPVSALREE